MNLAMNQRAQSGVALLAVLWLTVALTFIGMATAQLVRTEVEAVSNQLDSQRAYYLARGGIETAIYSIEHSAIKPPDPDVLPQPSEFAPGRRWLAYQFESGAATVAVMSESGKLNVNVIPDEQLAALFLALGLPPDRSIELAAAIKEWRAPRASDIDTPLDLFYANSPEPYTARHAALNYADELLPVRGMTRDLFFGRTIHDSQTWSKAPDLSDLLTTQAAGPWVNPNYAAREVLQTLPGWSADIAAEVVAARERAPFRSADDLQNLVPESSGSAQFAPLTFNDGPLYTLTATGFLPGSRVRRSVRALVWISPGAPLYHQVLGWWDSWPTPTDVPQPATEINNTGKTL
jgi:type II secretory pathway component PulK